MVASTTPSRLLFRVPVYEREWTVPLKDEVGLRGYWDSDHEVEYDPDGFSAELLDAGIEVKEMQLAWGEIWAVAEPVGRAR